MLATCPGAVPSAASWGMWEPRCPQAPLPLRGPLCLWPRWSASQRARALDIRGPPPRPPSGLLRRCTRLPCAERRPQEPSSGPHTEAEAEAWPFGAAPAPVSQRFLSTSSQRLLPAPRGEGRPAVSALCTRRPTSGRRALSLGPAGLTALPPAGPPPRHCGLGPL